MLTDLEVVRFNKFPNVFASSEFWKRFCHLFGQFIPLKLSLNLFLSFQQMQVMSQYIEVKESAKLFWLLSFQHCLYCFEISITQQLDTWADTSLLLLLDNSMIKLSTQIITITGHAICSNNFLMCALTKRNLLSDHESSQTKMSDSEYLRQQSKRVGQPHNLLNLEY